MESHVADRRRARWQLLLRQPAHLLDQFLVNKTMAIGDAPMKVNPPLWRSSAARAMINPEVYLTSRKARPHGVTVEATRTNLEPKLRRGFVGGSAGRCGRGSVIAW